MFLLTLRDLQYRAMRFLVVVIATAFVFTLLLLMTGLADEFKREPHQTVSLLGADHWVLREGASGAFTSAATLEASIVDELVVDSDADPLVVARHSMRLEGGDPEDIVVVGAVEGGLGNPPISDGAPPGAAGEVVLAESANAKLGDGLTIGAFTYEVHGTTPSATMFAGMPLVFMSLDDAQELLYRGQELVTTVLIEGDVGALPVGLQALTDDEVAEDAMRPLERSISSINLIRGLLWVVAAMIIGAVVYLSALERQRDFAVLKAVGSSNGALLAGLAIQGVLVALVAGLVAVGLQYLLVPVFPLNVYVPTSTLVQLPAVAIGVALVASLAGLRRVAKADPAAAFSGPGN